MRRSVEVVRELVCDSHSFESERGVKALPEEIRVDTGEGATRYVERMFYFQRRRLFPH